MAQASTYRRGTPGSLPGSDRLYLNQELGKIERVSASISATIPDLDKPVEFSSAASSTSPTTGAVVTAGGIGCGENINAAGDITATGNIGASGNVTATGISYAKEFVSNGLPASFASLDGSTCITPLIANGGSGPLALLIGKVIIREATAVGCYAEYLVGNISSTMLASDATGVFVAPTTAPAAGHISVCFDGVSAIKIYNNRGAASVFQVIQLRIV